jgi:hypothetical protein
MKRLIFILFCLSLTMSGWAQHEVPVDTIRKSLNTPKPTVKQFGDYVLDMRLLNLMAPTTPKPELMGENLLTKDYSKMFSLDAGNVFSRGFTNVKYPFTYYGYSYNYGYGLYYGLYSSPDYMQMGSFKLKNGMRLNVYGQYSAEGKLLPGIHTLPWQQHDFSGAFELRSANGAFGIKIQVNRQNEPFY